MDMTTVFIVLLGIGAFGAGIGMVKGTLIVQYLAVLGLLLGIFLIGVALNYLGLSSYLWVLFTEERPVLLALPSLYFVGGIVGKFTG